MTRPWGEPRNPSRSLRPMGNLGDVLAQLGEDNDRRGRVVARALRHRPPPWLLSSARSWQWTYATKASAGTGAPDCFHSLDQAVISDRPGSGYDYDTFADDLESLIGRLDLREVTLVAHSAGSGDVARYMSRYGEDRVERAVLLAPTTPLLVRTEDNLDGLDPDVLAASAAMLMRDVPQWCADNAPAFFGATQVSPGLIDWVTRQIVDTPLKILLDTAAAFATTDLRAELTSLTVPTLIVHGDLDASAPIEITGRKTAALIPNSQLLVYEGSGHGLYAADHERLNSDILAFIGQRRELGEPVAT